MVQQQLPTVTLFGFNVSYFAYNAGQKKGMLFNFTFLCVLLKFCAKHFEWPQSSLVERFHSVVAEKYKDSIFLFQKCLRLLHWKKFTPILSSRCHGTRVSWAAHRNEDVHQMPLKTKELNVNRRSHV